MRCFYCFECKAALELLAALPPRQRAAPPARELAARCHFELAEYQAAAELFAQACASPRGLSGVGLEYYSTALWHLQDTVKLGALAQQCMEWDRQRPQSWCVAGNSFSLQKEHEQAIRCFRRVMQMKPSFTYAFTLAAHEYSSMEKLDQAVQLYEQAIALDPRHYNAWWGLGNVYLRQEQSQNAKFHFTKAIAINRGNPVLRTSLGMALQSLDQLDRALEIFTAVKGGQCSALAAFQKGCTLSRLGRFVEALPAFRDALLVAPREPCIHFQLGRAHLKCGQMQSAVRHLNLALDLCGTKDPTNPMVIEAELALANTVEAVKKIGARPARCGAGPARSGLARQLFPGGGSIIEVP